MASAFPKTGLWFPLCKSVSSSGLKSPVLKCYRFCDLSSGPKFINPGIGNPRFASGCWKVPENELSVYKPSSVFSESGIDHRRFGMHDPVSQFNPLNGGAKVKGNVRWYSGSRKCRAKEDNVFIRSIASIVQKTDKWGELLKELCAISGSEITPPIAVQVIKRIRKPEVAFKFFDWLEHLEGFSHDDLTYSAILKVVTRDCNPSHAAIADSLLRKKIHVGYEVTPSDYDYVLHQCARAGRSDLGLLLLDEMVTRGFVPAITSCTVLLEELFQSKREDLGWDLFYQMLDGRIDAVETETFNVAMKVLCVRGKLEEALELFAVMKREDYVPDLDSFNILIRGCCEKGEVKMVFDLFKHMLDIKVKPDSYTMNLLIKELCRQGRPDYGNFLFNHLRRVGWLDRKFVYTQLVESLSNYGWWMKALKIFVKMVRRGHHPKVSLYNNLIRHLCMGGRLREASKLKDSMLSKDFLPEIEVYNGLMDGLCLIGRMDMVEELLLAVLHRGLNLNIGTYNIVLRGYCMARNVEEALKWVKKIKEKGSVPNTDPCNSLITSLCSEGRVMAALQVKDCIKEVVEISHDTYIVMMDELRKLSDTNRVTDLSNEMITKGFQPGSLKSEEDIQEPKA